MNKNLKASKSIVIKASADAVWDALTNPKKIEVYLYGTETITDWKTGSPIIFQGEYDGRTYKDKGIVRTNIPQKQLQYSYWSGFSGLEDAPENYSMVSYTIENVSETKVKLTWSQEGFASEENQQHSEDVLPDLLHNIKHLVEKN